MTISQTSKKILSWTAAVLWFLLLAVCSFLRGGAAASAMGGAAGFVQSACLALGLSEGTAEAVCRYTPVLLQAAGYMGMAFFAWNALRFRLGRRSSLILALAFTSLAAVLDECHQILVPGRYPRVADWLIDMAGAAVLVAGIWLFQVLWNRFPKLVNRETVSYVVFGVLTTVVNIVVYQLCYTALPLGDVARNAVSNTAAFILALIFAYVVNKLFVFQSKTHGLRELLWEAGKFAGARILSFAVDMAGMLLLVNVLHVHSGLSKISMNVIVMIMNYLFSKWFIFKDKTPGGAGAPEKPEIG